MNSRDATPLVALRLPACLIYFFDSHFMLFLTDSGDPFVHHWATHNRLEPLPQRGELMEVKHQYLRRPCYLSDEFLSDSKRTQCLTQHLYPHPTRLPHSSDITG